MYGKSSNLDILRSLAVLLVIARHLLPKLHVNFIGPLPVQFMGAFGVMLFFVHTAHVLMFSLERQQASEGERVYSRFLVRRAFRIYPLSVVVVLAMFALSTTDWSLDLPHLTVGALVSNLLLVQNITGAQDMIGPLWSLPIEVQMYLLLPAIFLVVSRFGLRSMWLVYAAAIVLVPACFYLHLPSVLYYGPCFIPGVIAFALIKRGARRVLPTWVLPLLLVVCVVLYSLIGRLQQTVAAYPFCLLVGLAIPFIVDSTNRSINAVCARVAKYSYGIYLIHQPVLDAVFHTPLPLPAKLGVFAAATGALSVLAFRFIEDPCIRTGRTLSAAAAPAEARAV